MPPSSKQWWETDGYDIDAAIPLELDDYAGPKGIALVRAWPDGRTDQGWGLVGKDGTDGFMTRYLRGEFNAKRVVYGYARGRWSFAFVMRSMRLVCIDIDGKNGGLEHAKRLGLLPPTLAETSKSGTGYHLWYSTGETWDAGTGYAALNDKIGVEQGVDFRAVGCIYHHGQQRWNRRGVVPLPDYLFQLLHKADQQTMAAHSRITAVLDSQDEVEILMMKDELIADLAKPVPVGKRNTTLFAIGSQLRDAGVDDWDTRVYQRGDELGLTREELVKIIGNIEKYGAVPTP